MRLKRTVNTIIVVVLLLASNGVSAQTPASTNYSVEESGFSSGSSIDTNSSSYNARTSVGNVGIGNPESTNYQAFAGSITPDQEFVELNIPVTTIDMGILDPGTPGTGTATFTARSYLDSQYVIVSPRDPPTIEGGTRYISPMTTATTFDSATEQFGMNLVANTSPVVQGAIPSPQPTGFAYGEPMTGYSVADNYRYNAGDAIAKSVTRGYGETSYTISYMMNITSTTPAGQYTMYQDLVMFAVF